MDDLELIDVRECPHCGVYYPEDNAHGTSLLVHLVEEHPDGKAGRVLLNALEDAAIRRAEDRLNNL